MSERNDRAELEALRELQIAEREFRRLEVANDLEGPDRPAGLRDAATERIESIRGRITELRNYLSSAGWDV